MDAPTLETIVTKVGEAIASLEVFQANHPEHYTAIEEAKNKVSEIVGFFFGGGIPVLKRPLPNMPQECRKCGGQLQMTSRLMALPLLRCECGWTWETWIKGRTA